MQYLPHIKRAEIDRRLAADPAGRKPWPRRPLSRSRCNRCFRIRGNFDRSFARVASWAELAVAPETELIAFQSDRARRYIITVRRTDRIVLLRPIARNRREVP